MKRFVKVITSAILSATLAVGTAAAVSAAGINAAEQKILNELNTTVSMNGVEKSIPAGYINQAENYFNTVEITDSEADQIVAAIEDAKSYLASTGAASVSALSSDQLDTFVSKVQAALSVINLTVQYTKSTGAVTIVDANGKVILTATMDASNGNAGSGSSTVAGENPIKTTGADFSVPGVVAVAGVGVLLVSAAGVYLFKASKKDEKAYEARA